MTTFFRNLRLVTVLWAIALAHISSLPMSWAADAPPVRKIRLWAFSPDNSQLFVDYCDADRCRVAAVALRTGAITLFTPTKSSYELNSPSLSYDGTQLASVITDPKSMPATSQIGILNLQKRRYRIVTSSPTFKEFPSMSADNTKIIFAQANRERRAGRTRFSKWDIYEVDVRTGTERRLTEFCFFLVGRPQYLSDGKTFVFSGDPTCNYPNRGSADSHREYRKRYQDNTIFRMVGGETTLEPLLVRGAYSSGPRVSKDGKKIVFVSRTNDLDGLRGNYNYDLFIRTSDVTKRLTNLKTVIRGIAFSGDGQLVAYESDEARNGNGKLWLLDLKTDTHRPLNLNERMIGSVEINEATNQKEDK